MTNQVEQLQNDLKLIQEVERHSNLYDPKSKDKDSKSRDSTWSVIGKKLNLAPDVCKNRWKNLRDKYTREKKLMMIEGEESYRNHSWPLLDEMSFLWNFVSHRKRPQIRIKSFSSLNDNGGQYSLPSEWMESAFNYSNCDDSSGKPNFLDPACVLVEEDEPLETNNEDHSPKSKLRRLLENKDGDNSDSPVENLTNSSYPESLALVKIPQQIRFMDEEEYFCMSLAASLRRLPKQKSSLLKIKIMQILYDAQFGENKKV